MKCEECDGTGKVMEIVEGCRCLSCKHEVTCSYCNGCGKLADPTPKSNREGK